MNLHELGTFPLLDPELPVFDPELPVLEPELPVFEPELPVLEPHGAFASGRLSPPIPSPPGKPSAGSSVLPELPLGPFDPEPDDP